MKEIKELYNENYKMTEERNQRQHQKMDRSSMITDLQNQYFENGHST
jgi:hypothetical protein